MPDNSPSVFKTKTGYCHILPDKIVLTRDGVIGDLAKLTTGNSIKRLHVIYIILGIVFLYFGYRAIESNMFIAALDVALGILLLSNVLRSLRNSATPVIERKQIRGMEFTKGVKGISRSYFVVYFQDEKGRLMKRLIMLPGALSNGDNETAKALEIMQREFGELKK